MTILDDYNVNEHLKVKCPRHIGHIVAKCSIIVSVDFELACIKEKNKSMHAKLLVSIMQLHV